MISSWKCGGKDGNVIFCEFVDVFEISTDTSLWVLLVRENVWWPIWRTCWIFSPLLPFSADHQELGGDGEQECSFHDTDRVETRAMVTKMTKSCVLSVLSGEKVQSNNSFTIQFSKKIIFSILANNSLFCVGFHLSVIIKMHELEYFWLTFTLWTFKTAIPPRTKLKLNQDMETNDSAKTEAILTGCDSNDKFDLVV